LDLNELDCAFKKGQTSDFFQRNLTFILKKFITGDYVIFENDKNVILRPSLCISSFVHKEN